MGNLRLRCFEAAYLIEKKILNKYLQELISPHFSLKQFTIRYLCNIDPILQKTCFYYILSIIVYAFNKCYTYSLMNSFLLIWMGIKRD